MHLVPTCRGLLRAALLASAVCAGAAFAAPPASFSITAPKDGATVESPVAIEVALVNAKLGKPTDGLDHIHVSVDGGPEQAIYQEGPVRLALDPGRHTVAVELAGPTHRPIAAVQSVTFTVK